jgi:hypothetical protein
MDTFIESKEVEPGKWVVELKARLYPGDFHGYAAVSELVARALQMSAPPATEPSVELAQAKAAHEDLRKRFDVRMAASEKDRAELAAALTESAVKLENAQHEIAELRAALARPR